MKNKLLNYTIGFQGIYYLITGLWPIIHLRSFEAITGPKDSVFLLHMTSLLIVVVSFTLLLSLNKEKSREIIFLAIFSPVAFMAIEIFYRAQIRWTYFLDFAVEVVILVLIIYSLFLGRKTSENNNKD